MLSIKATQPVIQKRDYSLLLSKKTPYSLVSTRSLAHASFIRGISTTAEQQPVDAGLPAVTPNETLPTETFFNPSVVDSAAIVDTATAATAVATSTPTEHSGSIFSPLLNTTSAGLEDLHNFTGMPWWATIIVATFTIRTCLLPIMINVLRTTAKMQALKPQMDAIMNRPRDTTEAAMNAQRELMDLMKTQGVSPFTPLKNALVQAPVFLLFFGTLRSMVENYPSFHTGGTLWFHDLALADPYYILPVVTSALFIATIEVCSFGIPLSLTSFAQLGADGIATPQQTMIKTIFRILGLVFIPITANFPAVC